MNARNLALTLGTMLALAVGQILFKLAARKMADSGLSLPALLHNGYLIVALVVYGLATIAWIALLREVPLSIAYPFAALAFFVVPLLAYWFLNEPLRWQTLAGAACILLGVWISAQQS